MIKLTKGSEPAILTANKLTWTTELLNLISSNKPVPKTLATKYNNKEVKVALKSECYSKCMYCESKVEYISDLHIEHIKPKAKDKFPELTFEYENLGLACGVCNRHKSDIYDTTLPFINPYIDDPTNHFISCGSFIWAKPGDKQAKLTASELQLNRPDLVEVRGERLKAIKELIDSYHIELNLTLKESIKKQILMEVEKDKVYSFCSKTLVDTLV